MAGPGKGNRSSRKRSQKQRLDALRKANEVRASRSKLKRDLATGRVHISDLLAHPPAYADTERIAVLLLALPGYGPARVSKLLLKTKISESKRLASLTERQRGELIHHFQP